MAWIQLSSTIQKQHEVTRAPSRNYDRALGNYECGVFTGDVSMLQLRILKQLSLIVSIRPPVFGSSSNGGAADASSSGMKFGAVAGSSATGIESKDTIPDDMIL